MIGNDALRIALQGLGLGEPQIQVALQGLLTERVKPVPSGGIFDGAALWIQGMWPISDARRRRQNEAILLRRLYLA